VGVPEGLSAEFSSAVYTPRPIVATAVAKDAKKNTKVLSEVIKRIPYNFLVEYRWEYSK
jgi:hypothetical protein